MLHLNTLTSGSVEGEGGIGVVEVPDPDVVDGVGVVQLPDVGVVRQPTGVPVVDAVEVGRVVQTVVACGRKANASFLKRCKFKKNGNPFKISVNFIF